MIKDQQESAWMGIQKIYALCRYSDIPRKIDHQAVRKDDDILDSYPRRSGQLRSDSLPDFLR